MAKIDIQNIFKTKKFTELNNKEKISWIDHFFGDDRDEDTDPNPWDAAFGVGADSTSLIPGTDSMTQYDYFLDEMWNLRSKLMKQKADTVSSIKPSPEVSSVIDSVDSGTIGTSYPGNPTQANYTAAAKDIADTNTAFNSADKAQTAFNAQWDASQNSLNNTFDWQGQPESKRQELLKLQGMPDPMERLMLDTGKFDGAGGPMSPSTSTDTPESLQQARIQHAQNWADTNDFGGALNSDFEGNYDFEALRDIAVNKNNTQAYNKPFNGEVSRDNTSQPRMMQTENGLRPMTEQEMYESNKYNASQKILALTGQDDESIARAKAQPIVKPDTTISDGKMGLLGGQPTIPFETLEDTPKPNLDRLGNVIEDDSGFTGQDVKNWLTGVGDDIATFANDAGDYWNKTSLEDMGDDLIDAGADGIAWAANNPLEALSYGLMVIPGVGLVGGVALRTAIGAGKVVLSKPAKAAYKAVTSDKSRTGMYKAIEKIKTTFRAPPAQVYAQSGKGGGAMGNYNANIVARNKLINQKTKETASKTAKANNKTVVVPSTKYGPFNPLRPAGVVTKAAMKNPVKSFVAGAALNTAVTEPGDEFYNKFGDKKVVASELGTSINPTIDATVNNMTQAQVDSLPSAGQDWWTALEEQDAQQMQAIRDYEIRAAAQQNVKAKTTLEDVPIDFGPFGRDFHQRDGTNVWTKFRNY